MISNISLSRAVASKLGMHWLVARRLNECLRKTLEYETPAKRFNACIALSIELAAISNGMGSSNRCEMGVLMACSARSDFNLLVCWPIAPV